MGLKLLAAKPLVVGNGEGMIGLKLLATKPLAVGSGAGMIGLAKAADEVRARTVTAAKWIRLSFMGDLLDRKNVSVWQCAKLRQG